MLLHSASSSVSPLHPALYYTFIIMTFMHSFIDTHHDDADAITTTVIGRCASRSHLHFFLASAFSFPPHSIVFCSHAVLLLHAFHPLSCFLLSFRTPKYTHFFRILFLSFHVLYPLHVSTLFLATLSTLLPFVLSDLRFMDAKRATRVTPILGPSPRCFRLKFVLCFD